MSKTNTLYCYKCGAIATGKEHVPPKCIFPDHKGLPYDFKKNLITVPSCDEHNQKKTNDDEYFMMLITPYIHNNIYGQLISETKVKKAHSLKPKGFYNKILQNAKYAILKADDGSDFPIMAGNIDISRLKNYVEAMAYGLYYHEYKSIFRGKCFIEFGFTVLTERIPRDYRCFLEERLKEDFLNVPKRGENPQIFNYQFTKPDAFGLVMLKMTFYEACDFYIVFAEDGTDFESLESHNEEVSLGGLHNLLEIIAIKDPITMQSKLKDHLKRFPPCSHYYSTLGGTYWMLKDFKQAELCYESSIKLDESNINALNGLGLLNAQKRDISVAMECYQKAISLNFECTEVRLNYGILLITEFKNNVAAKHQYEAILSYDPNEKRAHLNLANFYRDDEHFDFEKVVHHFEKALEIDKNFIDAYIAYGNFLQTNGHKEKGVKLYHKAKSLNNNPELHKVIDALLKFNK